MTILEENPLLLRSDLLSCKTMILVYYLAFFIQFLPFHVTRYGIIVIIERFGILTPPLGENKMSRHVFKISQIYKLWLC